jgi:RNA-splicing ligase RtcB
MILEEIVGKFATCKVFTADVELAALQQIHTFLDCPVFEGSQVRIMPDVHAGSGAVVGFTAPVSGKVIPNVIGVDIGCGMQTVRLSVPVPDKADPTWNGWFTAFDELLRAAVPVGFHSRQVCYHFHWMEALYDRYIAQSVTDDLTAFKQEVDRVSSSIGADKDKVWLSLGTLGGGNHFIEIGRSATNYETWLTVHSGSRNFGLRVAEYHQAKAVAKMGVNGGLEWLEGDDALEYLRDMRVAQKYASLNRLVILDALMRGLNLKLANHDMVTSVHNYIGDDDIIRKGAISAREGEKLIIPFNMRDGILLGVGRGNPDWNYSAPHGAGRAMSRGQAKRKLSMADYTASMVGIWSSCVCEDTLDEAPEAYKDSASVVANIQDTVRITDWLKPIYSFKATKPVPTPHRVF